MNWEDKTEVQKGDMGEYLVKMFLENYGFHMYKCISDGAHPIDYIAMKGFDSMQNPEFVFAEVKAKARRTRFNDTGINFRHYKKYSAIKEKFRRQVWLFFVDETPCIESIYGNTLSQLQNNITETSNGIIYFSLECMKPVANIPKSYASYLRTKSNSSRRYPYWNPVNQKDRAILSLLTGRSSNLNAA